MPKVSEVHLTKRVVEATAPGKYAWDNEVRGFGVRVTKATRMVNGVAIATGARTFLFRYKADGRQRYEPIGRFPALTVEQARDRAKALAGKLGVDHRELREQALEERRRAKTLADLEAHYLGDYAKARGLREATLRDARIVLRLVPESLRATKADAVTIPDIRRLHGAAREASGVYQANRLLAVLSKMFALAIEEGWRAGDNPCRGVKKFAEDQRWRNLSDGEVARLLDACDAYHGKGRAWRKGGAKDGMEDPGDLSNVVWQHNAADAVRLLLFSGARLQEVLKATWAEFDLEAGLWEKPSAHTKTKRQHRLELDGPALILLKEMRARDPDGALLFPGEPIVNSHGETEVRARSDLKRPWAWITKEAGLEGVRLHDLRRTTASFMLSGGASLATVGKALGHTQAATTARYAHLSQTVQREELKRAGERMAALRGTTVKAKVVPLISKIAPT
jgi:integrase